MIFDADKKDSFGTLKFKSKQYPMGYPTMRQMEDFEKSAKKAEKDGEGGLDCYYSLLEQMGVPKEVCPDLPSNILFGVAKKIKEEMSGKK